ncbi:MAG: T9SS type A sorting domain-containing protein [Imperialibacter sp.]|uniref:T9SS type A sorting domain-containing protein n=1 Tax=Imperialibacter sp. TaxID=2038411 RepID=UPI0032F03DD8
MKRRITRKVYLFFRHLIIPVLIFYVSSVNAQINNLGPYDIGVTRDISLSENGTYILSTLAGMYKQGDAGKWTKVNTAINNLYFEGYFVESPDGRLFTWDFNAGINYSEDEGNTWIPKVFFIPSYSNIRVNGLGFKGDSIIFSTSTGLAYVLDSELEARHFEGLAGIEFINLFVQGNMIFAGAKDSTFYFSDDGGASWKVISNLPFDFFQTRMIVFDSKIFVGTQTGGVWFSENYGESWVQKNEGLAGTWVRYLYRDGDKLYAINDKAYIANIDELIWRDVGFERTNGEFLECIAAKDEKIVITSRQSVYVSNDGGESWKDEGVEGITSAYIEGLVVKDDGGMLAYSRNTGSYARGLQSEKFSKFCLGYGEPVYVDDTLYLVINSGSHIASFDKVTGETIKYFPYTNDFLFSKEMVHTSEGFFVSTLQQGVWNYAGEATWENFSNGLGSLETFQFESIGDKLYVGTSDGLYVTNHLEANWQRIDNGAENHRVDNFIFVDDVLITTGFAAGSYRSEDAGITWSKISSLDAIIDDLYSFEGKLYAAGLSSIHISEDLGISWTTVEIKPFEYPTFIQSILVTSDSIYLGTGENGVLSLKNGEPQTVEFSPLEEKVFGEPDFVLAATSSSGLDVEFSSSDESILAITDGTASIQKAGVVKIFASQPGDETYMSVSTSQQLVIRKADQVITFDELKPVVPESEPFRLEATSSSGLPVDFISSDTTVALVDGEILSLVGVGTTIITASQEGNDNFLPAVEVNRELSVSEVAGIANLLPNMVGAYPNPTDDFLLLGTGVELKDLNYSIYTIDGRIVRIGELQSDQPEKRIYFGELKSGIYIIKITDGKESLTLRVIKN